MPLLDVVDQRHNEIMARAREENLLFDRKAERISLAAAIFSGIGMTTPFAPAFGVLTVAFGIATVHFGNRARDAYMADVRRTLASHPVPHKG